jgi:hypothetical protein
MKIRFLLALVGLAISFALPTFAQQTNTPDPQIIEQIAAHQKIYDEAMNNGEATALASKMFTEDAVLVTHTGKIYCRVAIEKYLADMFKQVQFSNHTVKEDPYHLIATTTAIEIWRNGEWRLTWQVTGGEPTPAKGYCQPLRFLRTVF